jgi:glycerophosphoryl diester phosphodiesterase
MRLVAALLAALLLIGCAPMEAKRMTATAAEQPAEKPASRPLIIAHRGASGERPEHTLAAYQRAIDLGADYIEPDLVLTKDGVLVARHENAISETTDVAARPEFADRKTTKVIDGQSITDWFTEDFTLAELKSLRARERLPQLRPGNSAYDGQYDIPTFAEVLTLLQVHAAKTGQRIGVYPETKHPAYFAAIGLPHEPPLLAVLSEFGYDSGNDPVFIQSFEVGNLRALADKTQLRLVQLIAAEGGPADLPAMRYADMLTPAGLADVAAYADGIGPYKDLVIARRADGTLGAPTGLVASAHGAGLAVHPWTMRAENVFLPKDLQRSDNPAAAGDLAAEIRAFVAAGVDGFFTDHSAEAVAALTPPPK